jgi:hypothetical protein
MNFNTFSTPLKETSKKLEELLKEQSKNLEVESFDNFMKRPEKEVKTTEVAHEIPRLFETFEKMKFKITKECGNYG